MRADHRAPTSRWCARSGSRDELIAASATRRARRFKAEWAVELPDGEELISLCTGRATGSTCAAGRISPRPASSIPHAFKLTRVSGAYWRGDQKNAMLSRASTAPAGSTRSSSTRISTRLEEAAKRDHRKIGQEMDLFHLQPEAHGSVFWHPKGYIIWRELEAYMRRRLDAAGYREVKTPQLMDARQWEQSGHWGKYRENMFVVPDEVPDTEDDGPVLSGDADLMALKPMNCPAHILIFRQGIKSLSRPADAPGRIRLLPPQRAARRAARHLMRVRQFTQDDAPHLLPRGPDRRRGRALFCDLLDCDLPRPRLRRLCDQARAAPGQALRHRRDVGQGRAAICATRSAAPAAPRPNIGWEELPGEGAFYAPKLEFHLTDAIGRTWQVRHAAARLRAARAARRLLCRRGRREAPSGDAPPRDHRHVRALHRHPDRAPCRHASRSGWRRCRRWWRRSSPTPTTMPARSRRSCSAAGIRVETDLRNEKINYKVREHSLAKVPYLLVVGKREAEEGTVALRPLGADARQEVIGRRRTDRPAAKRGAAARPEWPGTGR